MQHNLFINRTIFVASLMLLPLILPGASSAGEQVKGTMVMPEVQVQDINQIAVESVRDTLKACLGRIPSDATVGQLILAEQNCQQVDIERNRIRLSF